MASALGLGVLGLLLVACQGRAPLAGAHGVPTADRSGASARVSEGPAIPGARDAAAIPERVHTARRLVREHRRGEALRVLGEDRPLRVDEPERTWLLVALWHERHEGSRARRAAAGLPAGSFGDAIRALAAETAPDALSLVGRWQGGRHPWAQMAAAVAHAQRGDDEQSAAAATRALAGAPAFVAFDAYFARARAHMEAGRLAQASAAAARAAGANPRDARGPALQAELARRGGDLPAAVGYLIQAMQMAPGAESYPRQAADLLREQSRDMPWDALAEAVAPTVPEPAERVALRALVAKNAGRDADAIRTYREALRRDAVPVPVERELRELLAKAGRYDEVIALLQRAVPPDVRADPRNLRRVEWDRLDAFARLAPDPRADPIRRLELARTLVRLGALPEAEAVLERLSLPAAALLRARVAAHRAFERAMHREVEAGYRAGHAKRDPPDIEQVLARLRTLAEQTLHPVDRPAFRDPTRGLTSVPIIGTWLDHHTHSQSPVVRHFRRFGKFLMMGQRSGLPTEAIVLSIASLIEQQPLDTPGGVMPHDVAVGYDRTLRGFIDAQGGALGGACLVDGLWLDADSARRSENDLRRALRLDDGLVERAADLPMLAPRAPDGVFALTDSGGVSVRLLARYEKRTATGGWGSFGTLRAHEGSHALDIHRHLPIVRGLPRTLSLLWRNGFSTDRVEMELERRAQLGAVLLAPDPDLALVEMLLALPVQRREPEVHDGGYRDGLARLVRHVYARRDLYPQIDRRYRIVNQLDRLSPEQIRGAAAAVLRGG